VKPECPRIKRSLVPGPYRSRKQKCVSAPASHTPPSSHPGSATSPLAKGSERAVDPALGSAGEALEGAEAEGRLEADVGDVGTAAQVLLLVINASKHLYNLHFHVMARLWSVKQSMGI
jgi:hypothetical protein